MINEQAVVQTLVAEVRVLVLGNRQITTGVARQLDEVKPHRIEPFGRVEHKALGYHSAQWHVFVIGRDIDTGALVRSKVFQSSASAPDPERFAAWSALPLIVLAGR